MKTDAGSLKKGDIIDYKDQFCCVIKTDHNFRGRGSAVIKVKIKNIKVGNTIEVTMRPNEMLELLDVQVIQMQYLYSDSQKLYFMDERSYNQYSIDVAATGDIYKYFKEGEIMYVLLYNDEAITIRPPQTVRLKVTVAQDAVKGDTATAAKKDVTVETGVTVKVPLFIKKDDTILINPETGEYMERVNS
jgi:elongation factor P